MAFFSVIKRGPLGSLLLWGLQLCMWPLFLQCGISPPTITYFQRKCAPRRKEQEAGSLFNTRHRSVMFSCLTKCAPHPREYATAKDRSGCPFKWREADRVSVEKVHRDKGWSHILSYPSLGRQLFKRIRPETSWRGKDNALGKPPNPICCGAFIKEMRMSSQGPWETISCISTPRSWHTHPPRAHLPVCEFSLQTIKEQTPLQLEKIYSSLQESCRCS